MKVKVDICCPFYFHDAKYQLSLIAVLAHCTAGTCTLSVRHSWQTMCCMSLIILGFFECFALRRFVTFFLTRLKYLLQVFTTQCYGSALVHGFTANPIPGTGFWWPKIEKFYRWKILILVKNFKIQNLSWRTSKLQEKPPALKKRTSSTSKQLFFYFLYFFAYLDPGQADHSHQNQCGSGSATLLKINVILDKAGHTSKKVEWIFKVSLV